jgi:thiol:disulfide interchange protein DsbG
MHATPRKLLLGSALTFIPFLAVAAPLCAVQPTPAEPTSAATPSTTVSYPASNEGMGLTPIPAAEADQVPALQRIRASGAWLYQLGEVHGLRSVFAVAEESFQVFYLSPDGEVAIRGIAQDASGKNLTRDQVARVPGAIPTAMLGSDPHPSPVAAPGTAPATAQAPATSLLQAVQATSYGIEGRDEAPRLWVFIDPQCSFSRRAMQQLQPYVASGRVQLAVIPVSVLDREDQGLSTVKAEAMLGLPREQMVAAWAENRLTKPAEAGAVASLQANMVAADRIGLVGTPTFVWRKADGGEGRADGIPADLEAMVASASR